MHGKPMLDVFRRTLDTLDKTIPHEAFESSVDAVGALRIPMAGTPPPTLGSPTLPAVASPTPPPITASPMRPLYAYAKTEVECDPWLASVLRDRDMWLSPQSFQPLFCVLDSAVGSIANAEIAIRGKKVKLSPRVTRYDFRERGWVVSDREPFSDFTVAANDLKCETTLRVHRKCVRFEQTLRCKGKVVAKIRSTNLSKEALRAMCLRSYDEPHLLRVLHENEDYNWFRIVVSGGIIYGAHCPPDWSVEVTSYGPFHPDAVVSYVGGVASSVERFGNPFAPNCRRFHYENGRIDRVRFSPRDDGRDIYAQVSVEPRTSAICTRAHCIAFRESFREDGKTESKA